MEPSGSAEFEGSVASAVDRKGNSDMKVNEIFFSPTGSTKSVVRLISSVWAGEPAEIDCSLPDSDYGATGFGADELCIIGVPSFGGRVPAVALERLGRMKAHGTPAVIIATFGNRDYDDTLLELRDALKKRGFHVIAAIAAVTEHSIMRQFGSGRPNAADENELRGYSETIKRAMESGEPLPEVGVKGNMPYRDYSGLPFIPSAGSACNRCGTCAKVCPMCAIPFENPSETDKQRCITCMRCARVCPQRARKINPLMLFAAGRKMKKVCTAEKKNELHLGGEKPK